MPAEEMAGEKESGLAVIEATTHTRIYGQQ